jgi:hypothetical protein
LHLLQHTEKLPSDKNNKNEINGNEKDKFQPEKLFEVFLKLP